MKCEICGYNISGNPGQKTKCSDCIRKEKEKEDDLLTPAKARDKWLKKIKVGDKIRIKCKKWSEEGMTRKNVKIVGIYPNIVVVDRGKYFESYTYVELEEMKARRVNK